MMAQRASSRGPSAQARRVRSRLTRAAARALLVGALVAGLSACGGNDGSTQAASTGERQLTKLDVTSIPIIDVGPYYWALDTGLFREHGLEVIDHTSQGGAAGLPALMSGEFDIAFSNVVSAMLARQRGLPLKLVLGGDNSVAPPGKDPAPLLVAPRSSISSAKDLAGKTIGVNTIKNIDDIYLRAWIDAHGGDPRAVKLVEVAFPDHPAALLRRRVDAIQTAPPFSDQLMNDGAKVLGYPHQVQPGATIAGYVVSEKFLAGHGAEVDAFRKAMIDAAAQTTDPANRERLIDIVSKHTKIDVGILKQVVFPDWTMSIDVDGLRQTLAYMARYGVLEKPVDDVGGFLEAFVDRRAAR